MRMLKYKAAVLLITPSIALSINLQVHIKGLKPDLTNSIRADLTLVEAKSEAKLSVARIKNLYQLANKQITATLEAKGYYHSHIDASLSKQPGATPEEDTWIATFTIDQGVPTKIQSIDIDIKGPGRSNAQLQSLLKTPRLKTGDILIHENYEDTKDELLANLNAKGYLQAELSESVLLVNRATNTAEIKYIVNTGPQYTFGKVTFVDGAYREEFLQRFAPFKTGDPYDLEKLMQFQANLEAVDLFNKVRFDPLNDLQDPNNTVVPIQVRLHVKPKNKYTGSIGYGTDSGVRGSLGWLHRRRSTDGHKISTNIFASQTRSNARANYIIPGKQPATDKYIIGALGQIEDFEELYSRKAEISGSQITKRGRLESMYGVWYFTETFRITNLSPTLNKKYLLPTAKWIWLDPYSNSYFEYGTRLDFRVRAGAQALLSDNNVAQFELNAKKLIPVTEKSRLALRTSLGAVAGTDFDVLPPSLRFFTGGDDTVRGFAYNSLGPLADPNDPESVTGGRYLFVGSIQGEHKVYEEFSGVIFFDMGNASLSTKIPLAFGAGFGVRYRTPVGSFRLDLAKPLNTVVNKHWRVHLNFGTEL